MTIRRQHLTKGKFYRIEIYPKAEFEALHAHPVRERGQGERFDGKRIIGRWPAAVRRISKENAHIDVNNRLVIDNPESRGVLKQIRGPIIHQMNDVFIALARKSVSKRLRQA